MTFTVLAVDGLDIQRAGEYPWLSRELEDYKAIEVPTTRYYEEPVTPVVWASFLTGEDPEAHGVKYYGTWGFRPLDRLYWWLPTKLRYPYATEFLKRVFSLVNDQFLGIQPNIDDGMLGETWLHRLDVEFLDFPHINAMPYFDRERQLYREFFATDTGIENFLGWLRRDFKKKKEGAVSIQNSAVYYRHLDTLGHLMVEERRYDRWYRRFEALAREVAENKELLIVSDHGTTLEGHHTSDGFAGATFPLDGIETIMDFATVLPLRLDEGERP